MSLGSFKILSTKMCLEIIYLINVYKKNWTLDNPQGLIWLKTKPKQTKPLMINCRYI